MRDVQRIRLPASELGVNRNFAYGYVAHGDIGMGVWAGELNTDFDDKGVFFRLSHGSAVEFLSCLVGYYNRAEVPEDIVSDVFTNAATEVLSDPDMQDQRSHYYMHMYSSTGEHFKILDYFDQPYMGWEALRMPLMAQPGELHEVGGMGAYTRTDIFGKSLLVLARLEAQLGEDRVVVGDHAELTLTDVPPIARIICQSAMGEYRREMYDYIQEEFIK